MEFLKSILQGHRTIQRKRKTKYNILRAGEINMKYYIIESIDRETTEQLENMNSVGRYWEISEADAETLIDTKKEEE